MVADKMIFQVEVEDGFRVQHSGKMVFTRGSSRCKGICVTRKLGATEIMDCSEYPKKNAGFTPKQHRNSDGS